MCLKNTSVKVNFIMGNGSDSYTSAKQVSITLHAMPMQCQANENSLQGNLRKCMAGKQRTHIVKIGKYCHRYLIHC